MEPVFSIDWFSKNIPHWRKHLEEFRDKPVHTLEIGSWEGMSACWLLKNILTHAEATITCVDLFEADTENYRDLAHRHPASVTASIPTDEVFDRNIAASGAASKVIKSKGKSSEILRTLPLQHYNVIYIDASHIASDVLIDTVLSWDLLKPEGIMIFDDYLWPLFPEQPLKTPRPAIDAFLRVFKGQYSVLHRGYQIIIRKNTTKRIPRKGALMTSMHMLRLATESISSR
jgi:predicted O-methyltransferase YrrM